ncbi:MAG: hypothetical protein JNM18_12360 [Planctomycetaceae bacterium]|nr:hypothetical protein [Planctomycetaceae bacterium]
MRDTILHNAELLRGLNARIDAEFGVERMKSARQQASAMFWREHDRLSFPGGLENGLRRLSAGETAVVEIALQFLEVEPRFYRSGYIQQVLLQRLKHVTLSKEQHARLAALIVRSLEHGMARAFRGYARLAAKIHPPKLIAAVLASAKSPDAEVVRRAKQVLHVLRSNHIDVKD